jgi:tyrosine-protein phosphatase YwqE
MIAHVDRVQALYTKDQLAAVLECRGVVYQVNAGAMNKPRVQGLARALCAMGAQMVIGSDGHGEDYRKPDFSPARKSLGTWRAKRVRERMEHCEAELERAIF